MYNCRIIYEKSFPKISLEDYDQRIEDTKKEFSSFKHPDSQTFLKNLLESIVRIEIPERVEKSSYFLTKAKEVAECNEVDIQIIEYSDRYATEFHIDSERNIEGLKELIEYADTVNFSCDGRNAIVCLIYYTHATYRYGKQISPEKPIII